MIDGFTAMRILATTITTTTTYKSSPADYETKYIYTGAILKNVTPRMK